MRQFISKHAQKYGYFQFGTHYSVLPTVYSFIQTYSNSKNHWSETWIKCWSESPTGWAWWMTARKFSQLPDAWAFRLLTERTFLKCADSGMVYVAPKTCVPAKRDLIPPIGKCPSWLIFHGKKAHAVEQITEIARSLLRFAPYVRWQIPPVRVRWLLRFVWGTAGFILEC